VAKESSPVVSLCTLVDEAPRKTTVLGSIFRPPVFTSVTFLPSLVYVKSPSQYEISMFSLSTVLVTLLKADTGAAVLKINVNARINASTVLNFFIIIFSLNKFCFS
jgi:hypothetical protein